MSKLKTLFLKTSVLGSRKTISEYRDDKDGVAAIEFALIAPILIFMYLGLLEISMGIMADRDVSHATNVAGDLASQVEELQKAEIENILTAAVTVMAPKVITSTNIRVNIESWEIDTSSGGSGSPRSLGKATIGGAITHGQPDMQKLRDLNLLTDTSGVVIATINYDYEPVGTYFMDSVITLHETFVLKPRRSASIPMKDASGSQTDFTGCTIAADWSVSC